MVRPVPIAHPLTHSPPCLGCNRHWAAFSRRPPSPWAWTCAHHLTRCTAIFLCRYSYLFSGVYLDHTHTHTHSHSFPSLALARLRSCHPLNGRCSWPMGLFCSCAQQSGNEEPWGCGIETAQRGAHSSISCLAPSLFPCSRPPPSPHRDVGEGQDGDDDGGVVGSIDLDFHIPSICACRLECPSLSLSPPSNGPALHPTPFLSEPLARRHLFFLPSPPL